MATIPPPVAPSRPTGSLIVNSPFEPPAYHWTEENGRLALRPGRRPAGYEIFDTRNNTKRSMAL